MHHLHILNTFVLKTCIGRMWFFDRTCQQRVICGDEWFRVSSFSSHNWWVCWQCQHLGD